MLILNPFEPWPGELALRAAARARRPRDRARRRLRRAVLGRRAPGPRLRRARPPPVPARRAGSRRARASSSAMRPIAERHGLTLLQLAAQWDLAHEPVACVAPTLIQEPGGRGPIEDKRAELAADRRRTCCSPPRRSRELRAIGDNTGSMVLKGADARLRGRRPARTAGRSSRSWPRRRRAGGSTPSATSAPSRSSLTAVRPLLPRPRGRIADAVHPDRHRARPARREPVVVFFTSALGVIPTAALMGRATEELAARAGPGIGGLLNVTFGNAPELIIALLRAQQGPARGRQGLDHRLDPRQHPARAGRGDVLRRPRARPPVVRPDRGRPVLDADARRGGADHARDLRARGGQGLPSPAPSAWTTVDRSSLSIAVALVLILSYAAGLVFSLKTHRGLFNPAPTRGPSTATSVDDAQVGPRCWPCAGVAVGVMSEILVGSITEAATSIGLRSSSSA